MNEEYDRARRVSDRLRVYVCWSLDGERELFISHSCFYSRVTVYFRPGLFEDAVNSMRRVGSYLDCCDMHIYNNVLHTYITPN